MRTVSIQFNEANFVHFVSFVVPLVCVGSRFRETTTKHTKDTKKSAWFRVD